MQALKYIFMGIGIIAIALFIIFIILGVKVVSAVLMYVVGAIAVIAIIGFAIYYLGKASGKRSSTD